MSTLKVSLPPHLREVLEPLLGILPKELDLLLESSLANAEIAYAVIDDVSKWAHTSSGQETLQSKNLNPRDYDRLALLAGTVTGPSQRLPPPEPKPEPWEVAQDEKNTRRAIAALVNGLFSVVGIATAVWWASKTTGYSYETRVGLAVCGGLITALAEGGLFAIYYNRRESRRSYRAKEREKHHRKLQRRYLKSLKETTADHDTVSETIPKDESKEEKVSEEDIPPAEEPDKPLRKRAVGNREEDE